MIKEITLITLCAISIVSCKKTNRETGNEYQLLGDSLTSELITLLEPGFINGFATAIVNEEGVLYADGFGLANRETNVKYTQNTIQNIGSVSKTFIGIALLKAQEMGKLNLDDPINDYLPFTITNPKYPEDQITIRHLATHTSTILDTDFYDDKAYILKNELKDSIDLIKVNEKLNPPESKISMMDFLTNILSQDGAWYQKNGFLKKRPGEIFEYSNVGATLAAKILEIATGETFNEFASKHILSPLNMTSSGWSFADIDLSQHSKLYADPDSEIPLYSLITYPDGGLITSIFDLGKYLSELIKGHCGEGILLESGSYRELFREQLVAKNFPERDEEDDYDDEYNTGIFMGFTPRGFIGHTGGDPGIATYMFFNPLTKTGRILMINTSVRNSGGVEQFYSIWNKLGEYEKRFKEKSKNS